MAMCYTCQDIKKCSRCKGAGTLPCSCGDGKCKKCNGTGQYIGKCLYCDGSGVSGEGRCTFCNGSGKAEPKKCYMCEGNGICKDCKGSMRIGCSSCHQTGECQTCYLYRVEWNSATDLVKNGDAYNAVAMLMEMLKKFDQEKQDIIRENQLNERTAKEEQNKGMMTGGTIGLAVGSVLPVVGHVVGAAVGALIGRAIGGSPVPVNQREYNSKPFEAETHFRLGITYELLHNPAALNHYLQAKLLNPSHDLAAESLKRLQPSIADSPHLLKALDPDR